MVRHSVTSNSKATSAWRPEGATGGEDVPEACECCGQTGGWLAGCRNSAAAQNTGTCTHTQGGE